MNYQTLDNARQLAHIILQISHLCFVLTGRRHGTVSGVSITYFCAALVMVLLLRLF